MLFVVHYLPCFVVFTHLQPARVYCTNCLLEIRCHIESHELTYSCIIGCDVCTYSIWGDLGKSLSFTFNCISPNVGRYFGLVTGPPPPPPAMEAMEAAVATERFRRERSSVANLTRINLIFNLRHRRSEVTVFTPFCWPDPKDCPYYCLRLFVCLCVCVSVCLSSTLLAPKSFSRF